MNIQEQEESFWEALAANPDDPNHKDTRLVFSDWLLEVKQDPLAYILMRFMASGWYTPGKEDGKYYWSYSSYPRARASDLENTIPAFLVNLLASTKDSAPSGNFVKDAMGSMKSYYPTRLEADRDLMRAWVSFYSGNFFHMIDMNFDSIPDHYRPRNINLKDLFRKKRSEFYS